MTTGKISKKEQQRKQLIIALLQQPAFEKAAAAAGISSTTAWRIRNSPEFVEEYAMARAQCFSEILARLQVASGPAVSVLVKMAVDAGTSPGAKIRAATSVVTLAAKLIQAEEIEIRIAKLERASGKFKP